MIKPFNKTAARNDWAAASDRDAAVEEIEALYAQANQITRRRAEAKMPRFETRMTWDGSGNGHWEYAAWCKNLTDRWYRIYNLDLSGFLGIDQSVFGPPRTFGASVVYRWGK